MKKASKVSRKTNILVTGDLIRDYHIIKHPVNPTGYRDSLTSTGIKTQQGGAWYLAEFVRLIHEGSNVDVHVPEYPLENESTGLKITKAFQVWSQYEDRSDGRKKISWRVEDFLGCEKTEDEKKNLGTLNSFIAIWAIFRLIRALLCIISHSAFWINPIPPMSAAS